MRDWLLFALFMLPGASLASFAGVTLMKQDTATIYEAEDARHTPGFLVSSEHPLFSGSGYVDYVDEGYVEWIVNVEQAGSYSVSFWYALGQGNRPLDIVVNGNIVSPDTPFPGTGSWAAWNSAETAIMLKAGNNVIRAQTHGSSGPNIDRLELRLL